MDFATTTQLFNNWFTGIGGGILSLIFAIFMGGVIVYFFIDRFIS